MNTDVESCAGGVRESLTALRAIRPQQSRRTDGDRHRQLRRVQLLAGQHMPLEDLVQYQVTESLAKFHLEVAVNDLVTWAFPLAQRVQADVARQLGGRSASIRAAAAAQLVRDQRALDAQRAVIDKIIMSADRSLSARVAPPTLPN